MSFIRAEGLIPRRLRRGMLIRWLFPNGYAGLSA